MKTNKIKTMIRELGLSPGFKTHTQGSTLYEQVLENMLEGVNKRQIKAVWEKMLARKNASRRADRENGTPS